MLNTVTENRADKTGISVDKTDHPVSAKTHPDETNREKAASVPPEEQKTPRIPPPVYTLEGPWLNLHKKRDYDFLRSVTVNADRELLGDPVFGNALFHNYFTPDDLKKTYKGVTGFYVSDCVGCRHIVGAGAGKNPFFILQENEQTATSGDLVRVDRYLNNFIKENGFPIRLDKNPRRLEVYVLGPGEEEPRLLVQTRRGFFRPSDILGDKEGNVYVLAETSIPIYSRDEAGFPIEGGGHCLSHFNAEGVFQWERCLGRSPWVKKQIGNWDLDTKYAALQLGQDGLLYVAGFSRYMEGFDCGKVKDLMECVKMPKPYRPESVTIGVWVFDQTGHLVDYRENEIWQTGLDYLGGVPFSYWRFMIPAGPDAKGYPVFMIKGDREEREDQHTLILRIGPDQNDFWYIRDQCYDAATAGGDWVYINCSGKGVRILDLQQPALDLTKNGPHWPDPLEEADLLYMDVPGFAYWRIRDLVTPLVPLGPFFSSGPDGTYLFTLINPSLLLEGTETIYRRKVKHKYMWVGFIPADPKAPLPPQAHPMTEEERPLIRHTRP